MDNDALRKRSAETAVAYSQGNIANLGDAMTRRLIASTVMTESSGGNLSTINAQGYTGRYQAGAQWLVDAGYVDGDKLRAAMKGYRTEWAWADAGRRDNMDKFLADPSNWKNGLSLDKYLASAELQDKAFKINSDAAYRRAIKEGVLRETDQPEKIAGFLKARHISGYGGAKAAVTGGKEIEDSNGTSNKDYYNDIAVNRDGLNKYMGLTTGQAQTPRDERTPGADVLADGKLQPGERGDAVRGLQRSLNELGVSDERGQPLETRSGLYGAHTEAAVRKFQQVNGLEATGIADKTTLEAIGKQRSPGTVAVEAQVTGPVQPRQPVLLKQGARGPETWGLQTTLRGLGYTGTEGKPLKVDGDFGPHTDQAVRDFQRAHGLTPVDGKVGKDTREALVHAAQHPLVSEASHPNHKLYQAIATAQGLPAGTAPKVIANVAMYAQENGITGPERIRGVVVVGHDVHIAKVGNDPGDRIRVDLRAPAADLQAISDHMARQACEAARPQPSQSPQEQRLQLR